MHFGNSAYLNGGPETQRLQGSSSRLIDLWIQGATNGNLLRRHHVSIHQVPKQDCEDLLERRLCMLKRHQQQALGLVARNGSSLKDTRRDHDVSYGRPSRKLAQYLGAPSYWKKLVAHSTPHRLFAVTRKLWFCVQILLTGPATQRRSVLSRRSQPQGERQLMAVFCLSFGLALVAIGSHL